ncbi:MAG: right-handed parallel beta-helix repeat-containing protein [Candidatus Eisenbacteria bacterium]
MSRRPCLLSSLLIGVLLPSTSAAAVYNVRPDATGDFATIQAAINAASPGDLILLASGTFLGPGNRDLSFGGKAITIRSASGDPWSCTIDCQSNQISRHRGFFIHNGEGPASVVEGIRIINGWPPADGTYNWGGAMAVEYASPTIRNCVLENNDAFWGGGIAFLESDSVVEDVFLRENSGIGAGMYITTNCDLRVSRVTAYFCHGVAFSVVHSNPVFENCTVAYCEGGGWALQAGTSAVISRSIAAFNAHDAVACSGSSVLFECSNLFGNADGDWVGCASGQGSTNGNLSADPLFCVGHIHDVEIDEASPCAPSNSECGSLVGAWGTGCSATPTGACCETGTGQCIVTYQNLCAQGGEYLGDGVSCDPNPCNTTGVGDGAVNAARAFTFEVITPTTTSLRYFLHVAQPTDVELRLVDAGGRTVAQRSERITSAGGRQLSWNVGGLPSGAYWLAASAPGEREVRRVVILR